MFFLKCILLLYIYSLLLTYMSVSYMHAWYPQKPEEGIRSPKTRVRDGGKLPCGCSDSNLVPLQEQQILLTTVPSITPAPLLLCPKRSDLYYSCINLSKLDLRNQLKFPCCKTKLKSSYYPVFFINDKIK